MAVKPTTITTKVRLFLEEDLSPMVCGGAVVAAPETGALCTEYAQLAQYFHVVEATVTFRLPKGPVAASKESIAEDGSLVSAFAVPAEFAVSPALRRAFHSGALSDVGAQCRHFGDREADAWNAGRAAAGKPTRGGPKPKRPPAAAPTAPPKPVSTVGRDENGVPLDVMLYARDAYVEGREARRGGQAAELNPFPCIRGKTGGRHHAWLRGWQEAS